MATDVTFIYDFYDLTILWTRWWCNIFVFNVYSDGDWRYPGRFALLVVFRFLVLGF